MLKKTDLALCSTGTRNNLRRREMQVQMKVNGKAVTVNAAPNTLLVQALREHLHLTGTHVGCDTAQCGACTVHVNGRAVKSCNMLTAQAQGAEVTTIEGLATVHFLTQFIVIKYRVDKYVFYILVMNNLIELHDSSDFIGMFVLLFD
jgi:ferredoxin